MKRGKHKVHCHYQSTRIHDKRLFIMHWDYILYFIAVLLNVNEK